ncbi:hypothetical protein CISIN_1g026609mg [Citrus sinensis]|uniref:AMP-dependent synthetase/ligase domain-containing protein n=1 Tax=Citrus sinensis TaxID=2711 RepID=A0A067EYN0_CITSI|nr:hypothetical protein CISIN_1g026609mg [Citrus sinensis]
MVTMDQETAGELDYVFLCVLPLFHVFGLAVITCGQLQKGSCIILMAKFDLEMFLRAIEKHRVTHIWVVPPLILALAKHGLVKKFDLSSLKLVGSGAAPLGKELMEECAKNVPSATVIQVVQFEHLYYESCNDYKLKRFDEFCIFFICFV